MYLQSSISLFVNSASNTYVAMPPGSNLRQRHRICVAFSLAPAQQLQEEENARLRRSDHNDNADLRDGTTKAVAAREAEEGEERVYHW
jgi:hypothetical protein